jgi:hypothetical protein
VLVCVVVVIYLQVCVYYILHYLVTHYSHTCILNLFSLYVSISRMYLFDMLCLIPGCFQIITYFLSTPLAAIVLGAISIDVV